MDNKLLLILGGGALLYWWYSQQHPATAAPPPAATGTTPPPTTQNTNANTTPAPTGYPQTMAKIQSALTAAGQQYSGVLLSPDSWNYYANQAIPGFSAPAPEALFPTATDPHAPVTFQVWWSAMAKFLPAGLSGMGFQRTSPYWHGAGGWAA